MPTSKPSPIPNFAPLRLCARSALHIVAASCLLLLPAVGQQKDDRTFELRVEVHTEPEGRLHRRRAFVTLNSAWTPFSTQTWTDLGGRAKFSKLPAGLYNLTAEVPGRGRKRESVDISAGLADQKGRIRRVIVVEPVAAQQTAVVSASQLAIPPAALKEFSRAQKKLSKRKTDEAVAHLKRAVELAPRYSQALNNLGTIAYQSSQFEQARHYFEQALEADPEAYAPLVNLGGALIDLKEFRTALEVNRKAASMRPADPLAHSQLGLSLMALGKDVQAVEQLVRAKELDAGHFSFPQLALAQIHWRNGRREEAAAELREFLKLHPDAPQAESVRRQLEALSRSNDP